MGRVPAVMVSDSEWGDVYKGLICFGICGVLPEKDVYHVKGQAVLNGLFSVSKNEVVDTVELHRLIVNRLCRSLQGDTGTLPMCSSNAFYLEDTRE